MLNAEWLYYRCYGDALQALHGLKGQDNHMYFARHKQEDRRTDRQTDKVLPSKEQKLSSPLEGAGPREREGEFVSPARSFVFPKAVITYYYYYYYITRINKACCC